MVEPLTKHPLALTDYPLESYICHYEEVTRFQGRQLFELAVIGSILISVVAYAILSNNSFSLGWGVSGNIVAAAEAGALVALIAINGMLIHYDSKISDKYKNSSHEAFLKALMDSSTADVFKKEEINGNRLVAERFFVMLRDHFPDENWKVMLCHFDNHFFKQGGASPDRQSMTQVCDAFLKANFMGFLKNFYEMKESGKLSQGCVSFIETHLLVPLNSMDIKDLAQLPLGGLYFQRILGTLDANRRKGAKVDQTLMRVLETHPTALLKYYALKKGEGKLSQEFFPILKGSSLEAYKNFMLAIDQAYFCKKDPYATEAEKECLEALLNCDKDKFKQAYRFGMKEFSPYFRKLIDYNRSLLE
jgi:hypothetical protein